MTVSGGAGEVVLLATSCLGGGDGVGMIVSKRDSGGVFSLGIIWYGLSHGWKMIKSNDALVRSGANRRLNKSLTSITKCGQLYDS